MFSPALREFIEVWVGANVATGNEDRGYGSRNPYRRLADDVGALSDAMKAAIDTAGQSLPPEIGREFVAAMKTFVDDAGHNHLDDFSKELRDIGRRQVDRSIQLAESKYQILLEFIFMNLELALIAALAIFTGGTSMTQIAVVRSRTALSILLILQRMGHAVPTPISALLEAIQEAFITFAAQVISMTAPDEGRRRTDFDWTDIGKSAVVGALAGAFGGIFSQVTAPLFKNFFKRHPVWKEVYELPHTFINEGQAETFAETFTNLFFLGTFAINPATFVSAGLSGALFEGASDVAEYGGKWAHKRFFPELNFGQNDINYQTGGGRSGSVSGADNSPPTPWKPSNAGPDANAGLYRAPADYYSDPPPRPNTVSTYENWDAPDPSNSVVDDVDGNGYAPIQTANGPGAGPYVPPYRPDLDDSASPISDVSSESGSGSDADFDYDSRSDTSSVTDYDSDYPGAAAGVGAGGGVKYSSSPTNYDGEDSNYTGGDATTGDISGNSSRESVISALNPLDAGGPGNNPSADALSNLPTTAGSSAPSSVPTHSSGTSDYQEPDSLLGDNEGIAAADGALSAGQQSASPGSDTVESASGRPAGAGGNSSTAEEFVRERTADGEALAPLAGDMDMGEDADALSSLPARAENLVPDSAAQRSPDLNTQAARGHQAGDGTAPAPRTGSSPGPGEQAESDLAAEVVAPADTVVAPAAHAVATDVASAPHRPAAGAHQPAPGPVTTPESDTVVEKTSYVPQQSEESATATPVPAPVGTTAGIPGGGARAGDSQAAAPQHRLSASPGDADGPPQVREETPPPYRAVRTESEAPPTVSTISTGSTGETLMQSEQPAAAQETASDTSVRRVTSAPASDPGELSDEPDSAPAPMSATVPPPTARQGIGVGRGAGLGGNKVWRSPTSVVFGASLVPGPAVGAGPVLPKLVSDSAADRSMIVLTADPAQSSAEDDWARTTPPTLAAGRPVAHVITQEGTAAPSGKGRETGAVRTIVESSDTSSSGNVRSLPFAYGRTWLLQDSKNPAAASQTFTPKFTLTHNQETVVVTIPENFTAMSTLAFSSEPSRAYDYGMRWEFMAVPVDGTPSTDPDNDWSDAEPSPGRLATWFPHYLTENVPARPFGPVSPHDIPADPRTLMHEFPLYRVDTVRDPDAILDAILAADQLRPHLRRLSKESADELRVFLDENNQRTGLPLMVAGAYLSPILLDRSGEPIGFLELSAELLALYADLLAKSNNVLLESSLLHQIGAKNALSVSNAAKGGFTLTTNFLGDANPDGKFVFGGGYKFQQTRSLNSGGTAYDWFSLLSENHLLVDSDIVFRATLVLANGGRTEPFELPRPKGQTMRVPSQADAQGVPPRPGEELHLPPELVALRSLGISATPLRVTGTEPLFDQLTTLLRRNGFLAPSEPQRLDWLNDSAIQYAWLANARKLTMARSQIGLRGALGQIMDGGHPLYFDLPFKYDTWRISAHLTVAPQAGTYPTHRKNLPGLFSMNANGMSVAGSEGHSSNHSLYGDISAGLGGEAPDDWTVTGGIPYSASGTQQIIGNTAGSSSGFSLDMLTVSAAGLALFDMPATFAMGVFQGNGDTPLTTFDPTHGNISLTVPPARTLDTRPAPLAPASSRPATDEDFRKARMLPDAGGARPQDLLLLPASAHVNLVAGSAALTTAFKQLVAGTQPGHPEPGAFAQIVQRAAERGSSLADVLPMAVTWPAGMLKEGAGWLKDLTVGKPMSDAESTAQEVAQNVLSSTGLLSRGPQIFRGVYIFDAEAAGSLVGTDIQGEVRGYLHGAVYEGPGHPHEDPKATTYIENDLTTTDSASRGTTFSRSGQAAFSVTGTHAGDGSVTLLGSGGRSSTRSGGASDTDYAFTDRMHSEAHPENRLHGFRADATYVIVLNKGHRNAVANSVGLGPHNTVATAVHVPGAVVFWVSETAVRSDPQLARLAGIAPAQLPMDRLLPPYFARSGGRSLGFGTVPDALPTGGLDDFTRAIRAAVEREAPGSLTPGSGAHVRGLGQRIADVSGVTGLRSLASAGANHWQRFHIPYRGRTGLHLVEVALNARPAPGTDLRGVHGQLLQWSGQENMFSVAPSAVTRIASQSTAFTLNLEGDGGYTSLPGVGRTGSAGAAPSFSTASTRSTSETKTRHSQTWPRTFRRAADFQLTYEYQVDVSSVRLNDSALGFLANRVASLGKLTELLADGVVSASDTVGLTSWMDRNLGRTGDGQNTPALPVPVTNSGQPPAPLPAPSPAPAAATPVTVTLRFPGSEAPVVREDGTVELPAPPPVLITLHVHPADPRDPRYSASPAGVAAGSGSDPRAHLDRLGETARWTPTQPLAVYDFDALDELTAALNTVDPGLRGKGLPKTSLSAEATMRRIAHLIRRGKVTLTPAQASRFTGRESSGGSAHLVTTLYRPQLESLSRDVVSQGLRTTTHNIATSSSRP
ncbi:hypothetical protein ABCR94_11525 [Streptomyces sp. 21So2-11]|uniref:hypothetical protein n=1 Tax=Streptomyces sp. 21So2-11 TaxID=3144408 RepID=UPI0032190292